VKKDYPGFVFSVSRQFGAQQIGILLVFLLLKTYKDIRKEYEKSTLKVWYYNNNNNNNNLIQEIT